LFGKLLLSDSLNEFDYFIYGKRHDGGFDDSYDVIAREYPFGRVYLLFSL
jgi:hypothetical protein